MPYYITFGPLEQREKTLGLLSSNIMERYDSLVADGKIDVQIHARNGSVLDPQELRQAIHSPWAH